MNIGNYKEQPGRELTLEKKVKIIQKLDAGATQRSLARKLGISKSTVRSIHINKEAILKTWKINNTGERKKMLRKTANDMINTLMWQFLQNNHSENNPVSGPLLKIKALEMAKMLKIENFKASDGWLRSFLKARDINPRTFLVNSDVTTTTDEEGNGNEESEEMNGAEEDEEVNKTNESDKLLDQFSMEPTVEIKPRYGRILDIGPKEEQVDDEYESCKEDDQDEDEDELIPTHQEALFYAEKLLKYSNVHKPDLLPKLSEIYNSVEEICKMNH